MARFAPRFAARAGQKGIVDEKRLIRCHRRGRERAEKRKQSTETTYLVQRHALEEVFELVADVFLGTAPVQGQRTRKS
eukprot:1277849-Rhodomonas_salina.2